MQQENQIPEGHINLKEASRISGYAPDYVGQLIRKGKLYGRQVYVSVAWVTTEEALREYMATESAGKKDPTGGWDERLQRWENFLFSDARTTGVLKAALTVILCASVLFAVILLYALSVQIDRRLEERAVEKALEHGEFLAP
jgi:hypothetical protein